MQAIALENQFYRLIYKRLKIIKRLAIKQVISQKVRLKIKRRVRW